MPQGFKTEPLYMSPQECYAECLVSTRTLPTSEIRSMLRHSRAYHSWAIKAFERVLDERGIPLDLTIYSSRGK